MDLTAPRPVDATRFAMNGTAPARAWRPETQAEVADAVRTAAAEGLALVPWGGGIALSRTEAPPRFDVALDLSALRRITIHDADDFTITAECGITLEDLGAALTACRQERPLEAAEPWAATLGGVLAANASGPRRRRFGSPRDRLLGARFVTGDGVLGRSGGRVVKSVAGHAVHRLLVGSQGALGVFVEASLKLPPRPPARLAWVWGADAAQVSDPARWSGWPRREPAALTVLGHALAATNPALACDAPFTVVAGFEDDPAWLAACERFAHDTLGAARLKLRDASVLALWPQITDPEEMPGARLTFTSAHLTPDAIAFLTREAVAERMLFHAACGRLHLWPQPDEAVALIERCTAHGFTLLECRGIPAPTTTIAPAIQAIRARLRDALDPGRVFALGR